MFRIKTNKLLLACCCMLLFPVFMMAQFVDPDDNTTWSAYDPADFNFNNTMTIIAVVNVEGIESTDEDVVAAFINGDIRGIDTLRQVAGGRYLVALQISSNDLGADAGQDIIFRVWDKGKDVVLPVTDTIPYMPQAILGSVGMPDTLNTINVVISFKRDSVLCAEDNYGWAKVSFTGGTAPFMLDWEKAGEPDLALQGDGTDSIYGLHQGKYYLSITDANNFTKVDSVEIENINKVIQPPIIVPGIPNPVCQGSDMTLFAYNNETEVPRSIQWYDLFDDPLVEGPVLPLPDLQASTLGRAQSIVRNCVSDTAEYAVNIGLSANARFNVSSQLINEGGIVRFYAEDPDQDFYRWNFGDGSVYERAEGGEETNKLYEFPGTYFVELTTRLGECTSTEVLAITVVPEEEETPEELVVLVDIDHPDCEGDTTGSIFVQAGNGFNPVNYRWDTDNAVGPYASNLSPGNYRVTIIDGKNRVAVRSFTLFPENGLVGLPDSVLVEKPSCFGDDISLTVVNDDPSASFFWYDDPTAGNLIHVGGQMIMENVEAPTMVYVEKHLKGCASTQRLPVEVIIDQPEASFSVSAFLVEPQQMITVQADSVDENYHYAWDFGNGDVDTTSGDSAVYAYSIPGTYELSLTVTTPGGCRYTEKYTIQVISKVLELEFDLTEPVCADDASGVIVVQVKDGVAPFTYSWNTGETGPVASNLLPGTYQVEVTDANGNKSIGEITLISQIDEVPQAEVIVNGDEDYCIGEQISLSAFSDQPGAEYYWYDGQNPEELKFVGNVLNITVEGNQSFLVETHFGGCVAGDLTLVTLQGDAPDAAFTASADQADIDMTIDFEAVAINPQYSYEWNFGDGSGAATAVTSHAFSAGGQYPVSLTVTNAGGCQSSTTQTILINEGESLFAVFNVVNVECIDDETGSITATGINGTAPYTYEWSTGQNGSTINGLGVGAYYLTLTDDEGNMVVDSTEIISEVGILNAPNVVNSGSSAVCIGKSTTLYAYTDQTNVTFYWYDQAEGGNIMAIGSPLVLEDMTESQTYYVETRSGGCASAERTEVTIEVIDPSRGFTASPTTVLVNEPVSFSPNELTEGYSFKWQFGDGTISNQAEAIKSYDTEGQYTIDLISISPEGCVGVEQRENYITVISSTELTAVLSVTDVTCPGDGDGSITAEVFNGADPVTYSWNTGDTTATISGLSEGLYEVTIMDGEGFTITRTAEVGRLNAQPEQPTIALNAPSPLCAGSDASLIGINGNQVDEYRWYDADSNLLFVGSNFIIEDIQESQTLQLQARNGTCASEMASIILTVQKPDAGYAVSPGTTALVGETLKFVAEVDTHSDYLWQFGDGEVATSSEVEYAYTATGEYTVSLRVTDADGCTATSFGDEPINILGDGNLTFDIVSVQHVLCDTDTSGAIEIRGLGGTAPYSYAWDNGATESSLSGLSAGTYGFTITDSDQFSVMGSVEVENQNATIPAAMVNINAGDPVCQDQNAFLVAFNTAYPNAGFEWYSSFTSSSPASEEALLVLGQVEGDTTVFVATNVNGCTSERIGVDIVTQAPDADFSVSPGTNLMEGDLVQFLPNTLNEDYAYDWNFGDNGWSSFAEPYYFYNMPGVFDVSLTVIDEDGCAATVVKSDYINVERMEEPPGFAGDDQEGGDPELRTNAENDRVRPIPAKVFPNPFMEELTVLFKAEVKGTYTLELMDMLGQVIWLQDIDVNDGLVMQQIPTERLNLTNGMYLFNIRNGYQQTRMKILKNE